MATYKEIAGQKITKVASDPSEPKTGQMWYNSTTGTLRALGIISAWSSSAPLSTDRYAMGCGGTQTASVAAGGGIATPPYVTAAVEEYNGSGWSTAPSLNTARGGLGSSKDGSQTAMLVFGGTSNSTATESFNGSAWTTTPNSLNTGKGQTSGAGTSTAALNAGRWGPPMIGNTEEWNGSSWSEQNDLNTARGDMASFGSQTAAIFAGGNSGSPPNYRDLAEQYDGTSWTALPTLNTARGAGGSGAGSSTSGLVFGGQTPGPAASNASEEWDGSSWTATPNLAEAGARSGNGASASAGLAVGDYPVTGVTEEYNKSTNTITAAAWASGGTLPSPGRQGYGVGTGTQTASIIAGGPPDSTQNQFYDGASWTSLASIPSGVTNSQGFGDSEELLMAGGNTGSPYSALTYVYSRPGNSWTAVASPGNINTARALGAGCGALSTAGIIAGGDTPSYTTATESWNGSAWTTVNALPTATGNGVGSCGTQTAGLIFSGQNPGDPTAEETYEWDGTNWAVGGSRSTGVRAVRGGAGTATAALTFGGWLDPGGSVYTEGYDGTSWSTRPNMAGAAANNFQTGTQTAALRAGGTDGPGYTAVEEFTGETTAGNVTNFTTS